MLTLDSSVVQDRAEDLVQAVAKTLGDRTQLEVIKGESVIGGGAAPNVKPDTWLIHVVLNGRPPNQIDDYFRSRMTPVVGRIADDKYVLDLRTVDPAEEAEIRAAIEALADHELSEENSSMKPINS
jgi:L-seryl-tRNA(Ser) seleniumtransferase